MFARFKRLLPLFFITLIIIISNPLMLFAQGILIGLNKAYHSGSQLLSRNYSSPATLPEIFDLKVGESYTVSTSLGERHVKLIGFEEFWQPDLWIADNPTHKILSKAEIKVEVSGIQEKRWVRERAKLVLQPYQLPVVVNGLKLYVENTANWAAQGIHVLEDMEGDVRFSARDSRQDWQLPNLVFPIENYRWRSATYNNTWSSLVPYNLLYYHRGEDLGAIPDR